MKKYVLVPSSLSGESKTTLIHAGNTAKGIDNCEIILLTVINEEGKFDEATKNLENKKRWLAENFPKIKVITQVTVGEIAEVIAEVVAEYGVEYTFIKTNKPNSWEKVVGSHTMDIIGEADDAPFMVIQDESEYRNGYKKIVVPIDSQFRCKQKLGTAVKLAKEFDSQIYLFYTHESDDFLRHNTDANVKFAKKYLTNKGVKFELHSTTSSSMDVEEYLHDLLEYSNTIGADLICVVNFQRSFHLLSLPANNFENHLINNVYKIPVLIINPKEGITHFS